MKINFHTRIYQYSKCIKLSEKISKVIVYSIKNVDYIIIDVFYLNNCNLKLINVLELKIKLVLTSYKIKSIKLI
jgi:hypothetical protein